MKLAIAGIIFILAAVNSTIANHLFFSMMDGRPRRAALLSFTREIVTWGINLYVFAALIVAHDPWALLYILADAAGDSWRTWGDCKAHGRVE